MLASQVSQINKGLTEQVDEVFRNRPLKVEYPVIWIDALYEKVRIEVRVVSMDIQIVTGINAWGTREILPIEPVYQESEQTYTGLFGKLKERGLQEVWLVVFRCSRRSSGSHPQELSGRQPAAMPR